MKKTQNANNYAGYNNRPYKVMSPEDMSDDLMAFTFNPNFTPYDDVVLDLKTYSNELVEAFKQLKYCKIKLYHEISCNGKWHLHGLIKIIDKMKFTIFDLQILKTHGVFEIDTIGKMEDWFSEAYVFKQKKLMVPLLTEYGIPYSYNTIDDKLYLVKIDPLLKMKKCKKETPEEIPSWMPPPDSSI